MIFRMLSPMMAATAALALMSGMASASPAKPDVKQQAAKSAVAEKDKDPSAKETAAKETGKDAAEKEAVKPGTRSETIRKGDTLGGVLARAGAPTNQAAEAFNALRKVFNPRDLQIGQKVDIELASAEAEGAVNLQRLFLPVSVERDVEIVRTEQGVFAAKEIVRPLKTVTIRGGGTIENSLFVSGTEAGIPVEMMMEMIKIFSYDVDFQRDIQPGDGYQLVYEQRQTDDGKVAKYGRLLYASMTLSGNALKLFRYEDGSGFVDYYNPKGESVRKALLKTPIDGAKLTSGFGLRHHPILGYSAMHKGVDFGAPTGTPIQAAGDGIIKKYSVFSSYGNYAQIQHNNTYSTAYAHMSRYAPGLREGSRVRQGQIIGYVGTTGRSTGPHLHYEVLVNGSQINPLSVKLPSGRSLTGKDLKQFQDAIKDIEQKMRTMPEPAQIAQAKD
jgi:murein DD-endopeptidase MepM/ murein hydrolase activator NlpD